MEARTDTVAREMILDSPPDEVWPAVADTERIAEWFGATVEWDLEPGGRATFTFPDGRERPARIDEVVPGRAITFHYLPICRDVDGATHKVPGSVVEITLDPHERGTRLRVTETTSFTVASPRFLPPSTGPRWGFRTQASV